MRRIALSLSVSVSQSMTSAHVIHAAKGRITIIGGLPIPTEQICGGLGAGRLFTPAKVLLFYAGHLFGAEGRVEQPVLV